MATRKAFTTKKQVNVSNTNPPKIYDMKFYSEYVDPEDDKYWAAEKILYSFTFDSKDNVRSQSEIFLVELEDLDTGERRSAIQLADKSYYRLWQRQDEDSEDEETQVNTSNFIINSRVTITPINDFGEGEVSTFLLPFKDLVWTRAKDNTEETFSVLNDNWDLFSEDPDNRCNRSKIMYIYLDVPESDIELDRIKLSRPEQRFTCLPGSDYKTINKKTYRWSVTNDGFRKLTKLGWSDSTQDEQTFITNLVQSMLPAYRTFLTRND